MNVKKVASFAVGPIGGAALGFITLPIITWFYSAEDIGRIAMLQVVSSFCVLLFSLGLDQAYVRDYHESGHKPALFKAALLPGLLLLVMGLACCFVVPGFISKALFSVDSALISVLVALCWLAAFVSRFLSLILRMQERGLAFSMSQVLPKLLFLSVIGIYILFSFGFDLLYLVIAQALSVAAVTLIYGWNTRQEWLAALSQKVDTEKLKAMLRFGAPLIMGGAAFWGVTAMDKVFLRSLSSFEELGIYSVASSFAAAAVIFQSIFSTVWAPTVYKWAAEGINTEKIDQVTEYVLVAVVTLFSLAGLFSWIITYLLPPSYASVQYILVACMAYPLFYTLSEATGVGLGIARKSSYAMMASIIAVLVNFVGNYLLVPTYGAAGAAISTAFAFWAFFFCRTEFSCRVWRPIPRLRLYSMTLACLVISVLFVLMGHDLYLGFVFSWFLLLLINGIVNKKLIKVVFMKLTRSNSTA
ncbi:oligosaccharide flippase family protein [Pseudomonas sp. D(2018)]|uniref:oligosaccharide flippase family protein n=1 Tax=Pseudomonas sp. D(2018) TaxID=2502238 RepID=UPI0010F74303|nr:oligosaccharide flippase family protein [Pseudomonas sp. D(2018)]